ncbi:MULTISPECIES: hypothetical protein [Bacteroidaceae]|nr:MULTISPECIES: hypothetical protein [Bacteroidaceae]
MTDYIIPVTSFDVYLLLFILAVSFLSSTIRIRLHQVVVRS